MDVTMVKIMASVSIGCVTRQVPQPSDVRKVGRAAFSEPAGEVELVSCREVVWLEVGGALAHTSHTHISGAVCGWYSIIAFCFVSSIGLQSQQTFVFGLLTRPSGDRWEREPSHLERPAWQ